jgi:phosphoribosylglycinamide formyltransferase-1
MTVGSAGPRDPMPRTRVAVLISGRGSNMTALIEAARAPDFPAEIAVVISNRPDAAGLANAAAAKIDTVVVDHSRFGKDRATFERALQDDLDRRQVALVCLAGFMRLLTPQFVQHWHGRLLNIHPSLLPAFKGLHTHEAALQAGVKIHGATVHFVVPEVDSGPIVCQAAVAVRDSDTPATLAERVLAAEHRIYPLALRLVAEGRVRLNAGRCLIDGVPVTDAILLAPPAATP